MTRLTLPNERTHQFLFRPQKAARPMVYNPFSRLDPPIGSELVKSVRTFGRTVDPTAGCSFYLSSMNIELLQSLRIDRDQPGSHARFRSKLAPRDGLTKSIAIKDLGCQTDLGSSFDPYGYFRAQSNPSCG